MKKLGICILLTSTLLFGANNQNNNKLENLSNQDEVEGFFRGLEKVYPDTSRVIKDYFSVKTCKEDFYKTIDLNEIKLFTSSSPIFAFLIALRTLEDKKIDDIKQSKYRQILNDYLFMNCGEGSIFNKKEISIEGSSH